MNYELKNLNELAKNCMEKYKLYSNKEIRLSDEFKKLYKLNLNDNEKVEFLDYSTKIVTSKDLYIFMPNQWFALASYMVDYTKELVLYQTLVLKIFNDMGEKKEKLKDYKKNKSNEDDVNRLFNEKFYASMKKVFEKENIIDNNEYIKKFISDYEWWYGSKTIDRSDFYASPILNMLKLVNVTQSYVADITWTFSKNYELLKVFNETCLSKICLIDNRKDKEYDKNRLIYGAPGTGKSNLLEKDRQVFGENYERVTFYEDYSYSQFVGSYKPVSVNGDITYKFVAGPFLRQLAKALSPKNNGEPQLLIIEEINRANAASVFGDMFQLLDRKSNGEGEYKVHISDEMKKYLMDEYGLETSVLRLPNNFYLWATMNSADQGVFPLDSAFKRRFDEYKLMDINENEREIEDIIVDIKCNGIGLINWNMFRHVLNDYLLEKGVKDDKLIGPFFIKRSILEDKDKVQGAIKDKLLMYLLEDVVKRNRGLFEDNAKSLNRINNLYGKNNGENVIFAQDFMDMLNEVIEAGGKNETD